MTRLMIALAAASLIGSAAAASDERPSAGPAAARATSSAVPAGASQAAARSFAQLAILVEPGETVTVHDLDGQPIRGRITELSSSLLVLDVAGTRREFAETAVSTIRQRRADSLWNGAWWGLLAGAVVGVVAAKNTGDDPAARASPLVGAQAAAITYIGSAAMGAGLGVGIDAIFRFERVIYAGPGLSGRVRVRVSPLLTPRGQGVLMSFAF